MECTTLGVRGRSELSAPAQNVLLAEDNDDLRNVMASLLTFKGYNVIACCDGEVAFDAFQINRDVDLLLMISICPANPELNWLVISRLCVLRCPS